MIFDSKLIFICVIAVIVNILNTATSASRISGVETKRVATSMSLFNLFQLFARLSNLFYVPLLGLVVDMAVLNGDLNLLLYKMRFIILSCTIGSIIGFLLLPTFVEIYIRGINKFEKTGSLVKAMFTVLYPSKFATLYKIFKKPSLLGLKNLSLKEIPKSFLIYNIFVCAIWTIGVLCATYASAVLPNFARTATLLSGLVNGIATILFTLLVDPAAAMITDQAVNGLRPIDHVKKIVIFITLGNILGTLISQLLLAPGSNYIVWTTKLIAGSR